MSLTRYQRPSNLLNSLQGDLLKLLDPTYFGVDLDREQSLNATWRPQVDIVEKPDKYIVHADVPGVNGKDIKVSLDNNLLTIEGERKFEKKDEGDNYSKLERFEGSFQRQFTLPKNINGDGIMAKTKNGVLEVTIPKLEEANTRYINVEHND